MRAASKDPLLREFMIRAMYDEVIPTLTLPKQELEMFAASVFEPSAIPFIQHRLLNISLNLVLKYTTLLPSVEEYLARKGELLARLTFARAALITCYRALIGHRGGDEIRGMRPSLQQVSLL